MEPDENATLKTRIEFDIKEKEIEHEKTKIKLEAINNSIIKMNEEKMRIMQKGIELQGAIEALKNVIRESECKK